MTHSDASIHQLTETINTLAAVVAKNERRYLSIERTFRWTAVVFLCLTMLVFYLGFNMVSQVQATTVAEGPIAKIVQDIRQFFQYVKQDEKHFKKDAKELVTFVKNVDQLVSNLVVLTDGIVACQKNPQRLCLEVGKIVHNMATLTDGAINFSGNLSKAVQQQLQQQDEKGLTLASVMADIFILTHRLKLDSDSLRTVTTPDGKTTFNKGSGLISGTSIHEALGRIHREIQLLNAIINHEIPLMNDTMRAN